MKFENSIKDGEITVFLDSSIYNKDGIIKCLYWYSSKFNTDIKLIDDSIYKILIIPKSEFKGIKLEEIYEDLLQDFLDFNLRQIVNTETKSIRELLIAKAFSNGEFDEIPPGDISDPVGFKISE